MGDPVQAVQDAFVALAKIPQTTVTGRSRLYRSTPVDAGGPDYINAVAVVDTKLSAEALLAALQSIECAAGRTRPYWHAPRTLDLDLLLYGDAHIASATLTVPHPRMMQRAFVLRPLQEVAPERVSMAALQAVAAQQCAPLAESAAGISRD